MAYDDRSRDDYVDVAHRIADFRELYPSGSLQPLHLAEPWTVTSIEGIDKNGKDCKLTFIVYTAAAYRTPDDARPGIGCAYEVFPGRTPYTAGSELQNAETAAWGRAIVAALASDSKAGVASREEVRNRAAEREPPLRAVPGHPEVDEHGAATLAEQTRMVTGPVPGTERLDGTPPDDPWLAVDENGERRPPGKLPKPIGEQPPKPSRPRPAAAEQPAPAPGEQAKRLPHVGAIMGHFGRLGVADRAQRLNVTARLAGLEAVGSSNDLTEEQAKAVADALSRCKDSAALVALMAERELAAAEGA